MQDLKIKKLIRYAWIQLIVGLFISILLTFFAIKLVHEDLFEHIIDEVNLHHQVVESFIHKFQNEQGVLLEMLSSNEDIKLFAKDEANPNILNKLFYNTIKAHKNIMQLRFIDIEGQERLRIDQDKAQNITLFAKNKYQNKADRYYVQKFLELAYGEVGYSNFDLNEEHGLVEKPYNPTFRMGKGVYDGDKLLGIVVINFYMQEWIQSILNFMHLKIAMINDEGHYLMNNDIEWAWTAYSKTPKKAVENLPVETLPNFTTDKKAFYKLSNSIIAKNINLFSNEVLVTYKLEKSLNSLILEKVMKLSGLILLTFSIILLPMLFLIYRYVQFTNQNSSFLTNILDNMFDALVVIDTKANIQHVNKTAINLFGYSKSELLGQNVKLLVPQPHKSVHDEYVQNYNEENRTMIGTQRNLSAQHKSGDEIPISLAVTKIMLDEKVYFIASVHDLSEVKKLEAITRKQEALLVYQSKLASMGEMIGAIAHQWRQPLNELSIRIQKLKYSYKENKIDEKFVQDFITKNKTTIDFMSKTIDDFRNFFQINKEKKTFLVKESIEEVLNMLNAQLKSSHIEVEIFAQEFSFYGFKTEFQQVIMNIIGNSKDAFLDKKIQMPKITITIQENKILILDNAGGIEQKILTRVFEPYFTTKKTG